MSTIAVDAMSGDHGFPVAVAAAKLVLQQHQELQLILVGDEGQLLRALKENKLDQHPRISVQAASEVVGMDEEPAKALRGKKDSSMRVAINLHHEGIAQAVVSAGNTGALMATARFVLKMLPGVDRPAIVSAMPSRQGHTHMLDLGANAECSPEQLYQFGVMGMILARAVSGIENPRVGLLNIGSEDIKGNTTTKAAAALFEASDLPYIGFVEGSDIYLGDVDVVVCDGFTGNVALKSSEGLARLIGDFLREEYQRGIFSKLAAAMSLPVLNRFKNRVDPRVYNGATFLGLNGVVIKSHGGADAKALAHAIHTAWLEIEKQVPQHIGAELDQHLAR